MHGGINGYFSTAADSEITLRICFLTLDNMAFWLLRAWRHGKQEQTALEHNVAKIAWTLVEEKDEPI